MSEDMGRIRTRLREIGRKFSAETIQEVNQVFAGPHYAQGYLAPQIRRDLVYGPDPRHRLDVHTASPRAVEGAPVLLFAHGGGFAFGDKRSADLPYFDHIGGWAVRHGMVGVTINYRLAPTHTWPSGAEDIAAAVAWTVANISKLGGNPGRIVLAGHSAGATHIASFVAGQGGAKVEGVAAAIMISGIYDAATAAKGVLLPTVRAYYGSDERVYPQRSTLQGMAESELPMLFAVAELDAAPAHQQAWLVLDKLFHTNGLLPAFVWVPGHTHLSEIVSLGVDDDSVLDPAMRLFIARVTGSEK